MLFLFSCSTERPTGKTEAEVLFKEANSLIEDGRFLLATEKLNSLRSQYPYSYYATHAELLQADILFKQESYEEAASAYILFKDFHPKYKKMSYVIWKIAESFFQQVPDTHDRDLTPAHESIKYYQELLRLYRKTKFSKDALERIKFCKGMIRDKEQYIADFYYKTDVFDAARYRYLAMLKRFRSPVLRDHSMIRVVLSSANLGEAERCKAYYKKYLSKISASSKAELVDAFGSCTNN
jgi:outer membrane protein assembly factor BamD